MNKTDAIKAAMRQLQERGPHRVCFRCGHLTMKLELLRNAYSRHAPVYICDKCGTDEALRDMVGKPLPLEAWAIYSLLTEGLV